MCVCVCVCVREAGVGGGGGLDRYRLNFRSSLAGLLVMLKEEAEGPMDRE